MMTYSFLTEKISAVIKCLIVLMFLGTGLCDRNSVLAQIGTIPPERTGAIGGMLGTVPQNGTTLPPAFRDMTQPANGAGQPTGAGLAGGVPSMAGQEQPTPQSMQSAADQQPTLGAGIQQPGQTSTGLKDDPANLKSVRDSSHPLNDFLTVVKRTPTDKEREVYLYEILSGVNSPAQRRELLKAYWNLSEKMMQSHVRKAQRQRLEMVQGWMQKEQLQTDEIDLALQLVAQQYRALELEFIQAQYRFLDLQSRIPSSSARWRTGYADGWVECDDGVTPTSVESVVQKPEAQPLPIPADFPLAVKYDTKVDELQKRRSLSQKSLLLTHTIPLQYEAVVVRTSARSFAENQWQTVLTKYKQSPVTLMEAHAQEEMALISTIIEYNHQVDEYVLETFGANISEKQLLASILVLPKPATASDTGQNRPPTTFSTYQPE